MAAHGTLPPLSFVDPSFQGEDAGTSGDDYPHGDVRVGQAFIADVVHEFMASPQWKRGALFVVYDGWGGFFDHVRPPRVPDLRSSVDESNDFGHPWANVCLALSGRRSRVRVPSLPLGRQRTADLAKCLLSGCWF